MAPPHRMEQLRAGRHSSTALIQHASCSRFLRPRPWSTARAQTAAAVASPTSTPPRPITLPSYTNPTPAAAPAPRAAPAPAPAKPTKLTARTSGVAVCSAVGLQDGSDKPHNQDAFVISSLKLGSAGSHSDEDAYLVGVFDGHGKDGHHAAAHVASAVHSCVHDCARQALAASSVQSSLWWDYDSPDDLWGTEGDLGNLSIPTALSLGGGQALQWDRWTLDAAQRCLEDTFQAAAAALQVAQCDLSRSGSTAVVCMVLPDLVVAAWAGDSRAVIGTAEGGSWTVVPLTDDHKPNKLSELSRITAAGGRVVRKAGKDGGPAGPFRVCPQGQSFPGLSVARAFGDLHLASLGVTHTPDVTAFSRSKSLASASLASASLSSNSLGSSDWDALRGPADVLVLATDGLWEMVSNEEAVHMAAAAGSPEEGAKALVDAAQRRWASASGSKHSDDITVAVAFL